MSAQVKRKLFEADFHLEAQDKGKQAKLGHRRVDAGALWQRLASKTSVLFEGAKAETVAMRPIYWTEAFPVSAGSISLHLYPDPKALEKWQHKTKKQLSYSDFQKGILLSPGTSVTKVVKTQNVIYLSDEDRQQFRASVVKGELCRPKGRFKQGRRIFVLTPKQELFVAQKFQHMWGRIQHSSLNRGRPVLAAGWMTFDEKGKLTEISNLSGHYPVGPKQVGNILNYLEKEGLDLKELKIVYSPTGHKPDLKVYTEMTRW